MKTFSCKNDSYVCFRLNMISFIIYRFSQARGLEPRLSDSEPSALNAPENN